MKNYHACKELTQVLNGFNTINVEEPILSLSRLSLYGLSLYRRSTQISSRT